MKRNGGGADDAFRPALGERAVWDTDGPDHDCDCPGPPPEFYLPPPPRPSALVDPDCSENSVSPLETCEAVPVIDAKYHYNPAIPSLAVIVAVAVAAVVFLLIGTFLVVLKKRKIHNLFPRKSSPQNRCDGSSGNGVIYEDIRPSHCPPGQTTLPSIEMIDVASYPDHAVFAPVFICPTSPVQDAYAAQELFNPVYEELSNGGETDSEGLPQAAVSEDEFAEDELSLGGEDVRRGEDGRPDGTDVCRDVDSSDADDRSKFLENSTLGGRGFRRPKSLERKKIWRNKAPPLPAPLSDCNEFHEGFLLKKILQIYPDVTGVGLQYSRGTASPDDRPPPGGRYESLEHPPRRPKPEIFSTFRAMQGTGKNHSQESSLGSDSGYSNNTSGGKPRKEYKMSNTVLS